VPCGCRGKIKGRKEKKKRKKRKGKKKKREKKQGKKKINYFFINCVFKIIFKKLSLGNWI
jgi:hypothetical protein